MLNKLPDISVTYDKKEKNKVIKYVRKNVMKQYKNPDFSFLKETKKVLEKTIFFNKGVRIFKTNI